MSLTPRELRAIEIGKQFYQKDLEINLEEYHKFLDVLMFLHETLSELKIKMEEWQVYSDTLITKFYLHSNTLFIILSGTQMFSKYFENGNLDKKILDIPSSKVILRAQLESFLMYHHIYVNSDNKDEKKLRFNAWMHKSLVKRQEFEAKTKFSQKQKEKDAIEISKIEQIMQELNSFGKLTEKQQISLLKNGSDKLFKHWNEILIETGFKKGSTYFKFYKLLSSYAHSEALSILQLKGSKLGYNKYNGTANLNLFLSKILICKMIITIKKLYKIVEIKYNTLPQNIQDKVEFYALIV